MKKLNIYIKVTSDDDGSCAWWTFDPDPKGRGESYLCDGKELWTESYLGYEYCRGTPCQTSKQLKSEAKTALMMAAYDGMVDPKASFWKYFGSKLCQVKVAKNGRVVKI